ncbi:hypothetical protein HMPREF0372_00513 [Flavonifractor plautii ATCC 29863]|uniref:Uncharacterized protein n=1 Tax=Flavonifractor plautii ATCC 29863 TaxID=411475 RepID=G9YLZ7_FLAPL|nr:hypothetical protein HMPREF0372_00513 [Flavonifractor plautii ATCC 29863]
MTRCSRTIEPPAPPPPLRGRFFRARYIPTAGIKKKGGSL